MPRPAVLLTGTIGLVAGQPRQQERPLSFCRVEQSCVVYTPLFSLRTAAVCWRWSHKPKLAIIAALVCATFDPRLAAQLPQMPHRRRRARVHIGDECHLFGWIPWPASILEVARGKMEHFLEGSRYRRTWLLQYHGSNDIRGGGSAEHCIVVRHATMEAWGTGRRVSSDQRHPGACRRQVPAPKNDGSGRWSEMSTQWRSVARIARLIDGKHSNGHVES
jgi:hypothetical protein